MYLILPLAIAFAIAIVMFVRAFAVPAAGKPGQPLAEEDLAAGAGIEDRLAALLRFPTVSSWEAAAEDEGAFRALVAALPGLYPKAHAALRREEVGDRGLLYSWEGSEPGLAPVILCAHYDVVPAEDAASWRHAPFAGEIAEGAVWGRGSQDIKVMMACALEAVERLLARGFRPRRGVYLAFGGDEEVGGNRGARRIAALLRERGVRASFLLDEGGPVAKGMLAFADRPLALVGIAEKGYIDILLEASGKGGHASMPPRRSATGDLARAVAAIEASPSPARIGFTLRNFLARLSAYVPLAYRLLFRNLWLSAPLVKLAFAAAPTTNALLRSTCAPTMLRGSPKENVLAERAEAVINARILPGESSATVLARVARLAAPFGVRARAANPEGVVEPLPESPVDHEGFRAIEGALAASFPDAAALPFLFSAGTDTKHYREVAEAIYRLTPLEQGPADLACIHARDEHVSIPNLRRCLRFYESLVGGL
jgi:carboxypeptidase PM20D1